MRKIVSMVIMLLVMLVCVQQLHVDAAEQNVTAEKLWTVSLNTAVLNAPENLKKIELKSSTGELVPIIVTVNEIDGRILEVTTQDAYKVNEYYTLTIPAGFESKQGLKTIEDRIFTFFVNNQMTTNSLEGAWTTNYIYKDINWLITASFLNGTVQLQLKSGPTTHKGTENYEVNNGWMSMEVEDLSINLNGQIQVYNDKKFKIITKSGKVAYFTKVQ
ncbi:Ig-like domain-containing protein [Caryophanon latum]|uniref:SbsA Ig-like domain-containing protein n=1 Tax=Caryophanon latum TaxID=33977 RepID=A0A1C0YM55_9BACL|nr:Ig-like domain-containing protein [Caryophanon latum]OCS88256.1 hypothetical protein A6K76_13690 [Caryophanon latum]